MPLKEITTIKKTLLIVASGILFFLFFDLSQPCNGAEKIWVEQEPYRIGCGDILAITTWKEPDVSRENILVRIDGYITFPLLNDVQTAGLTTIQLKDNIEKGLKEFIDVPIVTITVTDPASQRFYILGEIARTGEYPIVKRLSVLQAFALAGGFTEWASKKEIILLRHEKGVDKLITINYKELINGKNIKQNITIRANDTIIIP